MALIVNNDTKRQIYDKLVPAYGKEVAERFVKSVKGEDYDVIDDSAAYIAAKYGITEELYEAVLLLKTVSENQLDEAINAQKDDNYAVS